MRKKKVEITSDSSDSNVIQDQSEAGLVKKESSSKKKSSNKSNKNNDKKEVARKSDTKKKRKKTKKRVDNVRKSDSLAPDKQIKNIVASDVDPDLLDDDYREGESKKRRKKSEPKIQYNTDFTFMDSIDVIGGDSRTHFLTSVDEGHEGYLWCSKFGFRLGQKLCGLYVTPKCKSKIRCSNFEYGMEVRHRYRLKIVDKDGADTKKRRVDEVKLEPGDDGVIDDQL